MPSHSERVRRNYDARHDSASDVRRQLFDELNSWAAGLEGSADLAGLKAAADALAAAATADEMLAALDAIDDQIARLGGQDGSAALARALTALRTTLGRDAALS